MFYRHLKSHIEAVLFASGDPVSLQQLANIFEVPSEQIKLLIEELKEEMTDPARGLTIVEIAGGYQLCTKPETAEAVEKLNYQGESKLSPAALETLAIIAFKQPVTRQEIENIRGVKVDKVINTLLDRKLIKEQGRKDAIGRPILYGTTDEFLQSFGLKCLKDLPVLTNYLDVQQPD